MKGNLRRLLPLLHTLVEERAGRGGFPPSPPALHEPAVLLSADLFSFVSFVALVFHVLRGELNTK